MSNSYSTSILLAVTILIIQQVSASVCNNYCKNGGTCTEAAGKATCACVAGWLEATCEQQDFCHNNNECGTNGDCRSMKPVGYVCDCKNGYTGTFCKEVACSGQGTFAAGKCTCNNGYTGSKCQNKPCSGHGVWKSGTCTCDSKYTGAACETTKVVCQNGGTWTAPNKCTCASGYAGAVCSDLDCGANGSWDSKTKKCACNTGYQGVRCEVKNVTCKNGGVYHANLNRCTCKAGFSGADCSTSGAVTNVAVSAAFVVAIQLLV